MTKPPENPLKSSDNVCDDTSVVKKYPLLNEPSVNVNCDIDRLFTLKSSISTVEKLPILFLKIRLLYSSFTVIIPNVSFANSFFADKGFFFNRLISLGSIGILNAFTLLIEISPYMTNDVSTDTWVPYILFTDTSFPYKYSNDASSVTIISPCAFNPPALIPPLIDKSPFTDTSPITETIVITSTDKSKALISRKETSEWIVR